ncbi:MAG: signal recognition particle [Labilithrix sp.]|nr:signal recognition particle [Labilithrix sp.]
MSYVDGFVLPLPKKNLAEYRRFARMAGKVWLEHGALSYVETVADDVKPGKVTSFPQSVKLKAGEVVVLSWATYKSRADRDRIMKKVMSDPRMKMDPKKMPFDGKRMFWGGFKPIVEL